MNEHRRSTSDRDALARRIVAWGEALGFDQIGFSSIDLADAERRLHAWLARGYHGEMHWMARHGTKRSRPAELVPDTLSVISARMHYFPEPQDTARARLREPRKAYIARYALGRDYHKVLRGRLRRLATRIEAELGDFGHRVFVDSAPVLEKPLAEKAGLGWIGKHTNLINRREGSWFFLGEIFTDLELPPGEPASGHCGSCRACLDVCPTDAIVAPYELDARRCISYLTIELKGSIPVEFRRDIGNRVFGCDDCQLVCPWNRYARPTDEADFRPRHGLDDAELTELFRWDEDTWRARTEGSALRRVGYTRWLRNIAVALGNAAGSESAVSALRERAAHPDPLVREHVHWALGEHAARGTSG